MNVDHFSFDCMEKIQLPAFGQSAQPAATYFLRKFSVTPNGIYDEVTGKGIVYLHSELFGKTSADHVISVLDKTISNKKASGINNRHFIFNADNWKGNKNFMVILYLALLVKNGLYDEAEAAFMLPGHTKFSPDRMFAWLANMLKMRDIFEISDIIEIAGPDNRVAGPSRQESYSVVSGDEVDESGMSILFSNYKAQLKSNYRQFRGISKFHRFRVRNEKNNIIVEYKPFSDSPNWTKVNFLIDKALPALTKLKPLPLKKAKINDLKKHLPYVPGKKLSYIQ